VSDTESFIEEVSEEVRRERLFGLIKRYGWIAALAVILIVGGASYLEFQKSRKAAAAQATGDAVLEAMNQDDSQARIDALSGIDAGGDAQVLVLLLAAADKSQSDQTEAAIADYQSIASMEGVDPLYRDLANIKALALQSDTLDAASRRTGYEQLALPGAPFRLLAEEQLALLDLEGGETDAAIDRFRAIIADGEVTSGLRRRAQQMIVSSGAELEEG